MTIPNSEDPAQGNYGDAFPSRKIEAIWRHLRDVGEDDVGKTVKVRAWIQNARMQGAKMAFVELREERNWSIQGIVIAAGAPVSRRMVKWVGSLRAESFVLVEGTIKRPVVPVKSCRVSNYEIHLTKVYCEAPAPEVLGLGLAAANRAISEIGEEDPVVNGVESLNVSDTLVPTASLATHLNNPVMHKRAPVSQAIADVRMTVRRIFSEYLDARGFNQFEPPYLLGAASEGGANVFRLTYFGKDAFLAQSPQFYKQIEIAGGRKKVYCIGPAFRAENSNTPRHMTEVC
jgi:aspartyl-tRNA synthetase